MILLFAGIVAGIVIGVIGSLLVALVIWREEQPPPEYDLADLMLDLEPDETPLMSEIERHRQAHLAARGGGTNDQCR